MFTQIHISSKVAIVIAIITICSMSSCRAKEPAIGQQNTAQNDINTAVFMNNIDALKQHIASGSNLNVKDPVGGSTPLINACLLGKTEMAKCLIDAGADLNIQNNDGSTALLVAAFFCRPELVKILLQKGADKSIKNKFGSTAYESVSAPFSSVKGVYEGLEKALAPLGLKLDYGYMEKTRPEVATMLR